MGIPSRRLIADISNNNPRFDAHAYRRAGHRAIAIKATEGVGGIQGVYANRVAAAHFEGLHVVHYHFAHPDTHGNAAAECAEFLSVVKRHWKRGDRVAIDIEVPPVLVSPSEYVASWHHHLRENAGHVGSAHAWVYTYTGYVREHGLRLPRGWRLWLADYSSPVLGRRTGVSVPWAHQFTDGVHGPEPHGVAGVGQCDVSALSRRAAVGLRIR